MSNEEYKVGDRVKIMVGGPHENLGRHATVGRVQHNGDLVVYFGDQDEDEWVYSPNELARILNHATRENAEAIRNLTDRALGHLIHAEKKLKDALTLAEDDYDNNADRLRQIVGTIGLLSSAVSVEHFTWSDYARARK